MKNNNRIKKTKNWIKKHLKDKYVKLAHKNKLRARSWFKLDEINRKEKLIKSKMTVIDLGCSPGSWSEYIAKKVNVKKSQIIACDMLYMKPIHGVDFIQGDFKKKNIYKLIKLKLKKKANLIISDALPNLTGCKIIDNNKISSLLFSIFKIANHNLCKRGNILIKAFNNEELNIFLKKIKNSFFQIKIKKPKSSRSTSSEVYIIALGFKI